MEYKTILFLLLASNLVLSSKIKIEPDGGYTGIVIKVGDEVPEKYCQNVIKNLKILLKESSANLHSALNGRAYFKSITVVIPSSWRDSKCNMVIRSPEGHTPYRDPAIIVGPEQHPIYGSTPYTQQSRGCGQKGDFISLPHTFLSGNLKNLTFRSAQTLTSLWTKYRYGVFDEFGFVDDLLYPNYYVRDGIINPSGSYNEQPNGLWLKSDMSTPCSPREETGCSFYLDTLKNPNLFCSLNYAGFLSNVTQFCPEDVPVTPTKHRILCNGKSVLDVISDNEDFLREPVQSASTEPAITFVRNPVEQFVLLIENSASMDNYEQWKWINKGAQKFIRYDLPVDSNIAIVTFSNASKVEHPMVQVSSNKVRANLADTVPDKYHLSKSNSRCVLCGLKTVIHEVLRDTLGGAHIVLITQGSEDTLSMSEENVVKNYMSDYDIKLSTIILPNGSEYLDLYDNMAVLTGGSTHVIRKSKDIISFYASLNEAMGKILQSGSVYPNEMPRIVHTQEFPFVPSSISSGSFNIDSTLGRDTLFGIYVPDEEDHLIKSIKFTDSSGKIYGPYLRMSSTFDLVNFKTINFPSGRSPPFNSPHTKGMIWNYEIEWYPTSKTIISRKNVVVVTSKPRNRSQEALIDIQTWTSNSNSSEVSIYAKVSRGPYDPITFAKVYVSAIVEQPNGSFVELPELSLFDDGNGDPDLIGRDGIYSRYLSPYLNVLGRYVFKIKVLSTNESKVLSVSSNRHRSRKSLASTLITTDSCCGSIVESKGKPLIRHFVRFVDGPVLRINSKSSKDHFPPSKIVDLSVETTQDDKMLFRWTAPGGDYREGSVGFYKAVFSDKFEDLLSENGSPRVLESFDRIEEAGTLSSIEIEFPEYDHDYYVGLFAYDIYGNPSKISNLVRVRLDSPPSTTIREEILASIESPKGEFDWVMIGVISGILGVLLLLVIVAIIYYFAVSRKKGTKSGSTSSVMAGNSDHETDSSSFDSDIKNIMAHPLGPTNQPTTTVKTPSGTSEGTETTTTVTPVYWSASQLLSKLDSSYPYEVYGYQVPPGPQSLQQFSRPRQPSIRNGGPSSLVTGWSSYDGERIPDEYTITVGNLGDEASRRPPTDSHKKHRNITQV